MGFGEGLCAASGNGKGEGEARVDRTRERERRAAENIVRDELRYPIRGGGMGRAHLVFSQHINTGVHLP